MRRTLILILGVALFGILTAVVVASQDGDDPVGAGTTTGETTERTNTTEDRTTTTEDRTTTTEDNPDRVRTNDDAGVDISGPCDEAENANDPRCTGAATGDHRGGGGDDSGPGSSNSGPGGGDDSGRGGGGGDNSGPGSD